MKRKYEITCECPSSDGWHSWVIEDVNGNKIYIEGSAEDLVKNLISDANQKYIGNRAKMREALGKINSLCGIGVVDVSSFEIGSICDAALAAPRNLPLAHKTR